MNTARFSHTLTLIEHKPYILIERVLGQRIIRENILKLQIVSAGEGEPSVLYIQRSTPSLEHANARTCALP